VIHSINESIKILCFPIHNMLFRNIMVKQPVPQAANQCFWLFLRTLQVLYPGNSDWSYNIFWSSEPELWVIYLIWLRTILMPTEHYYAYVLSHPHAYLPGSYHMHFTDYYFTAVKITDTRSSGIPELHHTLKYINCSTPCISPVRILT
jgi:hypothetical protein